MPKPGTRYYNERLANQLERQRLLDEKKAKAAEAKKAAEALFKPIGAAAGKAADTTQKVFKQVYAPVKLAANGTYQRIKGKPGAPYGNKNAAKNTVKKAAKTASLKVLAAPFIVGALAINAIKNRRDREKGRR